MSAKSHNIQMVEIIASGFRELLPEVVFIGGATTTLYLSDETTKYESSVRPTDDVDCVIEVASRTEYAKLEKKIRSLGFKHSTSPGAPLCRWTYSGVTVDIMPTNPEILGFSNKWYKSGMDESIPFTLPSKLSIRIFTLPYFLASKLEAFKGRGKGDILLSRDFEDIITLINARIDIRTDLFNAPEEIKTYFRSEFQSLEKSEDFLQGISAHLPPERKNAEGSRRILDILRSI
ncbi:MAG: hypothetical protein EB120_04620 [Proteobacteria bacterium]|nr:hypothetical protein [Pseudomonadota bacterium]NDC25453.1 hypothetical protein [Pseudomonadota bacterium]NDG26445.1 hypothetical protein [Pseudomonadota bacterium]